MLKAQLPFPATETKVDSGNSSENVVSTRSAIDDAKKRMFGDRKNEVQAKPEPASVESKGEEPIVEDHVNEPTEVKPNDGLLKAREKDKKQISKLTAQKYALKEEIARLQAEIENSSKIWQTSLSVKISVMRMLTTEQKFAMT